MKHTSRPGFTLIELMVVIGIIFVLVAIIVLGLRHVNYVSARHETIAEMKICQDLLTEFKNVHGSLAEMTVIPGKGQVASGIEMPPVLPSQQYQLTLPPPWQTVSVALPVFIDATPDVIGAQPETVLTTDDLCGRTNGNGSPIAGNRDMGDKIGPATARYYANAVQWTQAVNYLLLREPKNRSVVTGSVPAKRLLETPSAAAAPPSGTAYDALASPVILDGWGNPIVYVPRGGMHVTLNNSGVLSDWVVRSSGTYPYVQGSAQFPPPVGPNDHPFFASAGQDGVFTDTAAGSGATADYASDNIYSFQE